MTAAFLSFCLSAVLGAGLCIVADCTRRAKLRPSRTGIRIVAVLERSAAFLPVLAIALFAALVVRARWMFGHWPHPSYYEYSASTPIPQQVRYPSPEHELPVHSTLIVVVAWLALIWMDLSTPS